MSKILPIIKPYLYALLFFVMLALIGALIGPDEDEDFLAGRSHYGTLLLSCEIADLPIYIDQELVGVTSGKEQRFPLATYGTFGRADHELVIRQEIDERREYFFREEFSFNLYIDVEENPVKRFALFLNPPAAISFPPENVALQIRLKPEVLAKQTGLVKSVKLKHNQTWNMTEDENYYYVLTQADTDLYRKSDNEASAGEFVEVYDKQDLEFIRQKKLTDQDRYGEDRFSAIGIYGDTLFIDDRDNGLLRLNKLTLEPQGQAEQLPGQRHPFSGFTAHEEYLIGFCGNDDQITVFKDGKFLYQIDQRKHYPDNIEEIHDYFDHNRVNSVTVHQGLFYATTWRGFINAYALEDGRFIRQINTIAYDDEYGYVVGDNIEAGAVYQQRYLYFSRDYEGLLILDSQTDAIQGIGTLFPERWEYSELLGEQIDMTKATVIHKMVIYQHYLIFTEFHGRYNYVYVYDLDGEEIVHKFAGHRDSITELLLDGNQLTGLSSNGLLYRWDLAILEHSSGE